MEAATATFDRSLAQRMEALAEANRIRVYRAEMKRDVKVGRRSARELLASPPAELDTMKVLDLLLALPRVGRVKAMKALNRARIGPSKHVGRLSPRQRADLLALLALR